MTDGVHEERGTEGLGPGGDRFGREVAISYAFVVVGSVVGLLNNIVIARFAGAEPRGTYALVVAITSIVWPIGALGLHLSVTWLLGRGQKESGLWGIWLAQLGMITTLCALLWLVAPLLMAAAGLAVFETPLRVSLVALPAMIGLEVARGIWLGTRRIIAYGVGPLGTSISLLLLNIWLLPQDPNAVVLTLPAAYAVGLVATAVDTLRRRPGLSRVPGPVLGEALRFGREGLIVTVGEALLLRMDTLLMGSYVTLSELGIYAIADQIAFLMAWGGLVGGRLLFARTATDPRGESVSDLRGAIVVLTALVVAELAGFAIIGRQLIEPVFGAEFNPSYAGVLALGPSAIARVPLALLSGWLAGRDRQRAVGRVAWITVVLQGVAIPFAAAHGGWLAVALTKSGCLCLQLVLIWVLFQQERGVRAGRGP